MPRYAKKGSTKLDIMNKMFNTMKADPECKWVHIGNISDFNQIPNFASINPALYNDFIGSFIYSELAYTDKNKASKDLKMVNFDFENHDVTDDDFANKHSSLPDGTEFIWCWAGGGDSYGSECAETVGTDIIQQTWSDDDYQYLE